MPVPERLINSPSYWDARFATGDWEAVGGPEQTRQFAEAQVPRLGLSPAFSGLLVDFGCGLGDALPVYRRAFPEATLMGVDVSPAAVAHCRRRYGHLGTFAVGDHLRVPACDVLIASNVLEHLGDDIAVARALRATATKLFIVVPYREQYLIAEHLRRYDSDHFGPARTTVFASRGWSQFGLRAVWWEIYAKNMVRPLFGKTRVLRRLQIMYAFG